MKINVCFSPALYPFYKEEDTIVIVTDIFRATTTMCMALKNGATSIIPVETEKEAIEYKNKGYLVGGERNVIRFQSADFGNSPFEYTSEVVKGRDVVISTTNGTRAINAASDAHELVIGAFSNIDTVFNYCRTAQKDILVLCSGWQNRFSVEDTLFGGALVELLHDAGYCNVACDDACVALSMWKEAKCDIHTYIARTEHFGRLKAHNLERDAIYCLEQNTVPLLPRYDKCTGKITVK